MIDAIEKRASVRSFTDEGVSDAEIDELMHAAMAAPSEGNQMPWEYYVVEDAAIRERLAASSPYATCAANAPIVLVPCVRADIPLPECAPMDMSAAIENILLQATDLGLGAVWMAIAGYPERVSAVSAALGLPEGLSPFALVPVGHPASPVNARGMNRYDGTRIHRL